MLFFFRMTFLSCLNLVRVWTQIPSRKSIVHDIPSKCECDCDCLCTKMFCESAENTQIKSKHDKLNKKNKPQKKSIKSAKHYLDLGQVYSINPEATYPFIPPGRNTEYGIGGNTQIKTNKSTISLTNQTTKTTTTNHFAFINRQLRDSTNFSLIRFD